MLDMPQEASMFNLSPCMILSRIQTSVLSRSLGPKGAPLRPGPVVYSVLTTIRCIHYFIDYNIILLPVLDIMILFIS